MPINMRQIVTNESHRTIEPQNDRTRYEEERQNDRALNERATGPSNDRAAERDTKKKDRTTEPLKIRARGPLNDRATER